MAGEKAKFEGAQDENGEDRSRSTIKFPYGDLDDAIAVATAIWQNAGEECTRSQLGAYLDQKPTSGAYRLKLATGATFGLIKSAQGKVRLTDLGKEIVDPAKAPRAKVQSFYAVPLYKAIYDRFDGSTLPPIAALNRTLVGMGVSDKQVDAARQAFQRSAKQAGFFGHGSNRLVEPVIRGGKPPSPGVTPKPKDPPPGSGGGGGGGDDLDPFIQGLLSKLPASGTSWGSDDQLKWLQTAATIFGLMYGGDHEIEVRFKNEQQ